MTTTTPIAVPVKSPFLECSSVLLTTPTSIQLIKTGLKEKPFKLQLLFRGSVEGYLAKYFHYVCDGKGPTVTVVKSEHDFIFGGFTSVMWSRNIAFYPDPSAFIFSQTLVQHLIFYNFSFTLHWPYRNKECAVRHHSGALPTFGGGFGFGSDNDIFISESPDRNRNSFCNLGETYSLGVVGMQYGSEEAKKYLAGSYKFKVKEMEIFKVIFE